MPKRTWALLVLIYFSTTTGLLAAEKPVQQSWQCQAGNVRIVSNTPCADGAQAVSPATSVIYHCLRNGVSTFQQSPCNGKANRVHLYSDVRTPEIVKQGEAVHASTVARAEAARAAQRASEGSDAITVVGSPPPATRTVGDGKADGYRVPNRSTASGSGP
jgi:hypothetical protein